MGDAACVRDHCLHVKLLDGDCMSDHRKSSSEHRRLVRRRLVWLEAANLMCDSKHVGSCVGRQETATRPP
jgi:hypothetical protein